MASRTCDLNGHPFREQISRTQSPFTEPSVVPLQAFSNSAVSLENVHELILQAASTHELGFIVIGTGYAPVRGLNPDPVADPEEVELDCSE